MYPSCKVLQVIPLLRFSTVQVFAKLSMKALQPEYTAVPNAGLDDNMEEVSIILPYLFEFVFLFQYHSHHIYVK